MCTFWKKTIKIVSASGGPPPPPPPGLPPPPSHPLSAFASSALLHQFFNSHSVSFVEGGAGYPSYATVCSNKKIKIQC